MPNEISEERLRELEKIVITHRKDNYELLTYRYAAVGTEELASLIAGYRERETAAKYKEYLDKQLWQFVSLDEWLRGPQGEGTHDPRTSD